MNSDSQYCCPLQGIGEHHQTGTQFVNKHVEKFIDIKCNSVLSQKLQTTVSILIPQLFFSYFQQDFFISFIIMIFFYQVQVCFVFNKS